MGNLEQELKNLIGKYNLHLELGVTKDEAVSSIMADLVKKAHDAVSRGVVSYGDLFWLLGGSGS